MQNIPAALLDGNDEDEFDGVEYLVLHGPMWTKAMDFDHHARTVILPMLIAAGWTKRTSRALARLDMSTPWIPEALQ